MPLPREFIETSWHKNRTPESYERINRKIALHRFGEISEVADMAYEVLKNGYMNGKRCRHSWRI